MRRYEKFNIDGARLRTTIYPPIPRSENDIYIVTRDSDRLDLLAGQYYRDVTLWWIIASANNLGKGTLVLPPGKQLRIPSDIEAVVNLFEDLNETRG